MKMKKKYLKAFTLIELLVVIAIISLLSSIVMSSLNSARAKARDAKVISEFREIKTALAFYYDKYGKYPNETPVTNGSDQWWGNFNNMVAQLVAEGFLSIVPVSPSNNKYNYYNYGGTTGALLVTVLEAVPDTTTGIPPSCRIAPPGLNWCDQSSNKYYCICNPY